MAASLTPGRSFVRRAFLDHPSSVDETYLEHARVATHFGRELAKASAMAFVHALVPGLCCTSASDRIKTLNAQLMTGARGRIHGVDDEGRAAEADSSAA